MSKVKLDAVSAMRILKSRTMLAVGVTKNVAVNVSFVDKDGAPFRDENWDDGKPYAIANFNAINNHGLEQATKLYGEKDFQGACNTNESLRVRPALGKQLADAMFASVVAKPRTWKEKDDDGNETGEEITALKVAKATPNLAIDANDSRAFDGTEDIFADVEESKTETNAMPPA